MLFPRICASFRYIYISNTSTTSTTSTTSQYLQFHRGHTTILPQVNRLIQDHAEEVGGDGSSYYMAQVRNWRSFAAERAKLGQVVAKNGGSVCIMETC